MTEGIVIILGFAYLFSLPFFLTVWHYKVRKQIRDMKHRLCH